MAGRKINDEAEAIEALDAIARTGLELAEGTELHVDAGAGAILVSST